MKLILIEPKNIVSLAEKFGYRPRNNTPAIVNIAVRDDFNTSASADELCKLKKGATVFTNFEPVVAFETLNEVDFSQPANRIVGPDVSGTTTISVSGVSAAAGITKTFSHIVDEAIKFRKITLPDSNISEVVSVSATDGSMYYEVDSLAKDTIFVGDINGDAASSGDAAFILKLKRVPKRYTVELEPSGLTSIRFGPGILTEEDSEIIPTDSELVEDIIPQINDSEEILEPISEETPVVDVSEIVDESIVLESEIESTEEEVTEEVTEEVAQEKVEINEEFVASEAEVAQQAIEEEFHGSPTSDENDSATSLHDIEDDVWSVNRAKKSAIQEPEDGAIRFAEDIEGLRGGVTVRRGSRGRRENPRDDAKKRRNTKAGRKRI